MAFCFFTIPIHDSGTASTELNTFLASHRVLSVDRRCVEQGTSSFWSFCVDFLPGSSGSTIPVRSRPNRSKIDYREVLSPEDFTVYASLRERRRQIAEAEAVPVYTLFTNEQLAKMVQTRVTTLADLGKITGIGDARLDKYGGRMLDILTAAWKNGHETSERTVGSDPGPGQSASGGPQGAAREAQP